MAAIQRPSGDAFAPPGTDVSGRDLRVGAEEAAAALGDADGDAEAAGDGVGEDVGVAAGGVAQADAPMASNSAAMSLTRESCGTNSRIASDSALRMSYVNSYARLTFTVIV
jgi:hypothetical protein